MPEILKEVPDWRLHGVARWFENMGMRNSMVVQWHLDVFWVCSPFLVCIDDGVKFRHCGMYDCFRTTVIIFFHQGYFELSLGIVTTPVDEHVDLTVSDRSCDSWWSMKIAPLVDQLASVWCVPILQISLLLMPHFCAEEIHVLAAEPAWIHMNPMGFPPCPPGRCRMSRHVRLFHRREVDGMPHLDVLWLGRDTEICAAALVPRNFKWFIYLIHILFILDSYDIHLIFIWYSYDIHMIFIWYSYDIHMIFICHGFHAYRDQCHQSSAFLHLDQGRIFVKPAPPQEGGLRWSRLRCCQSVSWRW